MKGHLSYSFLRIQSDFCLYKVVDKPTRSTANSSSVILLSNHHSLITCEVSAPLGNSDHNSVIVCLRASAKRKLPKPPTKLVWLYKDADLPEARHLLKKLPVASSNCNIDMA